MQAFRGGFDGWHRKGKVARMSGHGSLAGRGKREPYALARAHSSSLGGERRRRDMVYPVVGGPFQRVPG